MFSDILGGLFKQKKAKVLGAVIKPPYSLSLPEGNAFDCSSAQEVRGRITVTGSGNEIVLAEGARFSGSIIISGKNNRVYLGKSTHYRGEILVKGAGQTVSFGDHSTTAGVYILCQEGCDVRIGKWCMFSREIEIRTTDAHSVIDRESGRRLNLPASIEIGDHVWVGVGAIINKGARIADDNIVGAMSFVSKSFEESGTIIAGVPAKVVRTGITWARLRKKNYSTEEMAYWRE